MGVSANSSSTVVASAWARRERGVDGRRVVSGFDGGDELAADAGPGGELGLGEPAFQPALAQARLA